MEQETVQTKTNLFQQIATLPVISHEHKLQVMDLLSTLYESPLELKECDAKLHAHLKSGPQIVTLDTVFSATEKTCFADFVRTKHAKDFITDLGVNRYTPIIDLLNSVFDNTLRRRFEELTRGCPMRNIHNVLHENLRICVYYAIGFTILGQKNRVCLLKHYINFFLNGNFPFSITSQGSIIFLVRA